MFVRPKIYTVAFFNPLKRKCKLWHITSQKNPHINRKIIKITRICNVLGGRPQKPL